MFALSLLWLLIGIITSALANAAKLQPAPWTRCRWLIMPGIGAVAALVGGWVGVLVVGQYLATGCALWLEVLGVVVVPKLIGLRKLANRQ